MRPASCRPPHLFLCFRFLLFYLSAACRLPRTRKMEQHQQLFATSPPYFDHQQELKTEGSTGMNSHNKAALYPSIKLSPPANSFARFSREATDDSRPQLASLEEAKLLASLAEVTPLESQSENIKRDLNALWDNRREDLDEDLLVCHEKLGDELFPSKRPRLSTFQVSESSPFRPYPRKEKIPPKTTLLSPKAPRLDNNAKNEVANDSYVFGVPNGHAYPPTLSAITPAAAHWYHPRFEFPPHAEENFVYHHFPSGSPPRRMCHSPVGIKNTVNPGSYYVPSHPHNADFLYRHRPSKGPARNELRPVTVLSKKFSWKQCPELEDFLIANVQEFLRYSTDLNNTAEQKVFNSRLTERFIELADYYGYVFDKKDFTFTSLRNRIRYFFKSKSYLNSAMTLENTFSPRSVTEANREGW